MTTDLREQLQPALGAAYRREIQLAARLHRPYVVPVLTAGEAGGLLYYTMPLVRRDALFEDRYRAYRYHQQYEVFPDGRRFVVLRPAAEDAEVVVVLNWLTELRARLAAGGERSR
jgi:hypothetical protein